MKILLADDDPKIHVIISMWLSKNGHQVVRVEDGREALAKIQEEFFDGLITDVNMPNLNGVELVKAVLALRQPPVFIVVLTSRCDVSQLQKELASASVHVFNKPFSPAALTNLIENLNTTQRT